MPKPLALPAAVFVVVYVGLLLCVPSQLVLAPLGAVGSPANLWGLAALFWWVLATVGGLNEVKGWTTLRVTLGLVALAVLLAYIAGMIQGWYAPVGLRQTSDELWTLSIVQPQDLNAKMITAADRGLLTFFSWSGIALLVGEGVRNRRDLDLIITCIAWFGAVVALIGIIEYFSGVNLSSYISIPGLTANSDFGVVVERSTINRVSSTAIHPIEFGVIMGALLWLALHRSLNSKRLLTWVPVGLIGLAVPMSVSRSGILALGVSLIVMLIGWSTSRRLVTLIIVPIAVVAIRFAAPGLVGTLVSLFTNLGNDPSIAGRTDDYGPVLSLYQAHPIFGRGLFTFVPRYYRILDNQLLMFLIEIGIVGLVAVLALFVSAFALGITVRRRGTDDRMRDLGLTLTAALAGISVGYATFDAWGFPMVAAMTFLLVGMISASHRIMRAENEPSPVATGGQP